MPGCKIKRVPKMPTLQSQIKINAPAEKVYEYVSDLGRHSQWAAHPLEITAEGSAPVAVGSKFSSTSKMMGKHNAKITVTEASPPTAVAFEAEDDTGRFALP